MQLGFLPGSEWVARGISDLEPGSDSPAAALVAVGAPRLRRLGFELPRVLPGAPERHLYQLLAATHGDGAHSQYNALIRRLVAFERAAECVASSTASAPRS